MLYGLLPLLRGWIYRPVEEGPFPLSYGEEKEIVKENRPGFLLVASAKFWGSKDAKYCSIVIEIEAETTYRVEFTPYGLYEFGLVSWLPFGAYLARYDDANNVYCVVAAPNPPLPAPTRFRVAVKAPTNPIQEKDTSKKIMAHAVGVGIAIHDKKAFVESLLKLLGR